MLPQSIYLIIIIIMIIFPKHFIYSLQCRVFDLCEFELRFSQLLTLVEECLYIATLFAKKKVLWLLFLLSQLLAYSVYKLSIKQFYFYRLLLQHHYAYCISREAQLIGSQIAVSSLRLKYRYLTLFIIITIVEYRCALESFFY